MHKNAAVAIALAIGSYALIMIIHKRSVGNIRMGGANHNDPCPGKSSGWQGLTLPSGSMDCSEENIECR